jgi:hypothetical protein
MRGLSLLLVLGLLAGIAYVAWPEPSPPPAEAVTTEPEAAGVPFLIKSKMRQIIGEWKTLAAARSHGDRNAAWTKINLAVQAIKERLHADGMFGADAMRSSMLAAAEELGYRREQAAHLIDAVLDGDKDGGGTASPGLKGVVEKAVGHALPVAPPPIPAAE